MPISSWAPPPKKDELKWAGPGKSLEVAGYMLSAGMVYWSKGAPRTPEASCIDLSLPVGHPLDEPKGSLGYWPEYTRMTPNQRANYLAWLAGGRKSPLNDIGYAFVFFYGLERRVLVDGADVQPALQETLRVLGTYRSSGSFISYLSGFIAYVLARKGVAKLPDEWFHWVFLDTLPELNEDTLAVALAWVCAHQRPLPAKLAFAVAKQDMRSPKSVVIKRAGDQFYDLFKKKYESRFSAGLTIRPAAASRERLFEFRPASPSLLASYSAHRFERVRLQNPLGVQSQFKPLVQIWTECVEELKPFSSKLGKGQGVLTREAFRALPQALKTDTEHPDKPRWEALVAKQARDDGFVFTTVGELAGLQDIPERPKLTLKQSLDLAETAHDAGFALVPDPRILRRSYDWNETVAVQRMEGEFDAEQEGNFRAAALMLEIGMAMAASDGKIDRDEVVHVSLGLKSQFKLNRDDARRLEAYREILIRRPPTLRSLSKFVTSSFDPAQREALGQFMLGVAAVDGVIDKAERKALENSYLAFGISVAKLHALLLELESPAEEPVTVQEAHPASEGERIPSRDIAASERGLKLNQDLINRILGETASVATMIGAAMGELEAASEEEAVEDPPAIEPEAAPSDSEGEAETGRVYAGLDPRYHSALTELITRNEWSASEFDSLARRHGLMPAAMVEFINSWTDERYGDFLIEEGDPYLIQVELLEAA
jgi:uncharacterized membrane protein YebE (DUF533 family)